MKAVLVAIWLLLCPLQTAASNFVTVKLPRGVELQIPKGWWVLNAQYNQLIETTAEAAMDLSGLGVADGAEVNLIAANSMPLSTYAAVRVDSVTPGTDSTELQDLSATDLQALEAEIFGNIKKLAPLQGFQVLSFEGVTKEVISGFPALATEYRRSGPKGPVSVRIIQIFTGAQDIQVNLSYRESELAFWKPVIGKIRQSITVRRWP